MLHRASHPAELYGVQHLGADLHAEADFLAGPALFSFPILSVTRSGMHGAVRQERPDRDSADALREQRVHSADVRVFHRHSEPTGHGRLAPSPFPHSP